MKLLAVGLWVTLVALGSAYGVALYMPGSAPKAAAAPALQYTKSRVLNVPIVAGGLVQGFMAVQLGFTVDASTLKTLQVPPEVYLLDEAFRILYADATLDFKNLGKFDVATFTKSVIAATNDHLGAPVIKDVLIEQFSYIPKDTIKG